MPTRLILLLGAAALPVAASAQASVPQTLTRTGQWVVNYDRDACHLLAQFGAGEDGLLMRLTRYEPGEWFDLGLYGSRLASTEAASDAKINFGLLGRPVEARAMHGKTGKLPMMLFGSARLDGWQGARPDEPGPALSPQQEAAVTGVTVKIDGKKPFRLQFGSLAKPMAQLRACQADLLKSWGYDPAVQTSLSRRAQSGNSPASWLKSEDYPSGALTMGHNGMVQFRLDVDAQGKVSGCHVLARTSPDVFADTTCRAVMRRAKFTPALDAEGKPVRSFYVEKVRWMIRE